MAISNAYDAAYLLSAVEERMPETTQGPSGDGGGGGGDPLEYGR